MGSWCRISGTPSFHQGRELPTRHFGTRPSLLLTATSQGSVIEVFAYSFPDPGLLHHLHSYDLYNALIAWECLKLQCHCRKIKYQKFTCVSWILCWFIIHSSMTSSFFPCRWDGEFRLWMGKIKKCGGGCQVCPQVHLPPLVVQGRGRRGPTAAPWPGCGRDLPLTPRHHTMPPTFPPPPASRLGTCLTVMCKLNLNFKELCI